MSDENRYIDFVLQMKALFDAHKIMFGAIGFADQREIECYQKATTLFIEEAERQFKEVLTVMEEEL